MSMGPGFNPHAKVMRELSRRAKKLLETRGTDTVPDRGTTKASRRAEAGRVFVYQGGIADTLTVRFRMLDKPGRPYTLVYTERNCDGEVLARFVDLLETTVKELRQQQILDDLANA